MIPPAISIKRQLKLPHSRPVVNERRSGAWFAFAGAAAIGPRARWRAI
jgi:hypothetical protein